MLLPFTVLIVEDDPDLLKLLSQAFTKQGYQAIACKNGPAGLEKLKDSSVDIILLDVMLPRMDGFDFCKEVRTKSDVPIIFLTAKTGPVDKLLGFRLGGDDYITKPFNVDELLLRVRAVLRRTSPRGSSAKRRTPENGRIEIDLERREVIVRGSPRHLTPHEFDVLALLVREDGRVVSRKDILEKVWGIERSIELSTQTVDQHIARIRKKLKPEDKRIETVTRSGYKFRAS